MSLPIMRPPRHHGHELCLMRQCDAPCAPMALKIAVEVAAPATKAGAVGTECQSRRNANLRTLVQNVAMGNRQKSAPIFRQLRPMREVTLNHSAIIRNKRYCDDFTLPKKRSNKGMC